MGYATTRFFTGLLAILPIGTFQCARAASAPAADTIRACINSDPQLSGVTLAFSQINASRLLAGAGVKIEWHTHAPSLCRGPQKVRTLILDFVNDKPSTYLPNSLAYTLPYEGVHILVFYDRIQKLGGGHSKQESAVLGHVMAHEIAHILQGVSRHSRTGIMKAIWSNDELREMYDKPLSFEPQDIKLIELGLENVGQFIVLSDLSSRRSRPHVQAKR